MRAQALCLALAALPVAHAADIAAGKAKVEAVCGACHGVNGVSTSDAIPNLAGQRAGYTEAQLKALKEGSRKSPIMNQVAAQLSAADMANGAAYFASLKGASEEGRSDFMPNITKTGVAFPENWKTTFTKYHTINFPASKQVRVYYANNAALQAAKAAKALPDGAYLRAKLLYYIVMERESGWGKDIPGTLRNEDWNYAVFTPARQLRPGVNQAECLACHKPLDMTSYVFTMKELAAAAGK